MANNITDCRFTLNEWYLNNRHRYRICLDQQALADKILAECDRVSHISFYIFNVIW